MSASDSLPSIQRIDTVSVPIPTMPSSPVLASVVDELFSTVSAEISGADTAEQGDALRVRAALLALDGLGDRARALELLVDAEHVLAPGVAHQPRPVAVVAA